MVQPLERGTFTQSIHLEKERTAVAPMIEAVEGHDNEDCTYIFGCIIIYGITV